MIVIQARRRLAVHAERRPAGAAPRRRGVIGNNDSSTTTNTTTTTTTTTNNNNNNNTNNTDTNTNNSNTNSNTNDNHIINIDNSKTHNLILWHCHSKLNVCGRSPAAHGPPGQTPSGKFAFLGVWRLPFGVCLAAF